VSPPVIPGLKLSRLPAPKVASKAPKQLESESFGVLEERAISLGVSKRDTVMCLDTGELRALIKAAEENGVPLVSKSLSPRKPSNKSPTPRKNYEPVQESPQMRKMLAKLDK